MSIVVVCPTCGQKASAPDETAGRKVQCPHCQAIIVVPGEAPASDFNEEDEPPQPVARRSRRPRDDYEEEDYEERPLRRRRRGFGCPYCGSDESPRVSEDVTEVGWVLFIVLILFCIPLCWIPLISCKERRRYCVECHRKIY